MTRTIFIAAALALAVTLPIAPAQATGVPRTFLSAAGSDSNNCANVATPCRHMAAAYAATAPNGEIYVLDPANYGSLTITGPVSIEGHGWASIAPPGIQSAAITINANAGDKINIIGVVLDGTAIGGTTGIFISGGSLTVGDSVIRNFGSNGIAFSPNSSSPSQLFVSNTVVADNGFTGIGIFSTGSGTTTGVFDHVELEHNGIDGLRAETSTQTINITVSDSVSANNQNGINADASGATPVSIMVRNSTIANNTTDGLLAQGSGSATIRVTRSTITGNGVGWANSGGGAVSTFGDNDILGNATVNNAPPFLLSHE